MTCLPPAPAPIRQAWTDGSSLTRGTGAGCGVLLVRAPLQLHEHMLPLSSPPFTNNAAELRAILLALALVRSYDAEEPRPPRPVPLTIYSDSTFAIRSLTTNRFRRHRAHAALIEQLLLELAAFHRPVHITKVVAHAGIPENETADRLAKEATALSVELIRDPHAQRPPWPAAPRADSWVLTSSRCTFRPAVRLDNPDELAAARTILTAVLRLPPGPHRLRRLDLLRRQRPALSSVIAEVARAQESLDLIAFPPAPPAWKFDRDIGFLVQLQRERVALLAKRLVSRFRSGPPCGAAHLAHCRVPLLKLDDTRAAGVATTEARLRAKLPLLPKGVFLLDLLRLRHRRRHVSPQPTVPTALEEAADWWFITLWLTFQLLRFRHSPNSLLACRLVAGVTTASKFFQAPPLVTCGDSSVLVSYNVGAALVTEGAGISPSVQLLVHGADFACIQESRCPPLPPTPLGPDAIFPGTLYTAAGRPRHRRPHRCSKPAPAAAQPETFLGGASILASASWPPQAVTNLSSRGIEAIAVESRGTTVYSVYVAIDDVPDGSALVQHVQDSVLAHQRVLLAGDFNADLAKPPLTARHILLQALQDAGLRIAPTPPTFYRSAGSAGSTIDYVLVSKNVDVVDISVLPGLTPLAHRAVRISWKTSQAPVGPSRTIVRHADYSPAYFLALEAECEADPELDVMQAAIDFASIREHATLPQLGKCMFHRLLIGQAPAAARRLLWMLARHNLARRSFLQAMAHPAKLLNSARRRAAPASAEVVSDPAFREFWGSVWSAPLSGPPACPDPLDAPPITDEILLKALARIKSTAPGLTGVPKAAYRHMGLAARTRLLQKFNRFVAGGPPDPRWLASHTVFLPKGATRSPAAYRPISVTETEFRLLEHCLALQHAAYLPAPGTDPSQFGFTRHLSTVDHLFALTTLNQQAIRARAPLYAVSYDVAKAFDSVLHSDVLHAHLASGTPPGVAHLFLRMLSDHYAVMSPLLALRIPITRGVLQGSVLSPKHFNVTLAWQRRPPSADLGVPLGSIRIESLAYADDATDVSLSRRRLTTLAAEKEASIGRLKMKLNASKTKVSVLGAGRATRACLGVSVTISGIAITATTPLPQLGLVFFPDRDFPLRPCPLERVNPLVLSIRRLAHHRPRPPLRQLAYIVQAAVGPCISYGSAISDVPPAAHALYNNALRAALHCKDTRTAVPAAFQEFLGLFSLERLREHLFLTAAARFALSEHLYVVHAFEAQSALRLPWRARLDALLAAHSLNDEWHAALESRNAARFRTAVKRSVAAAQRRDWAEQLRIPLGLVNSPGRPPPVCWPDSGDASEVFFLRHVQQEDPLRLCPLCQCSAESPRHAVFSCQMPSAPPAVRRARDAIRALAMAAHEHPDDPDGRLLRLTSAQLLPTEATALQVAAQRLSAWRNACIMLAEQSRAAPAPAPAPAQTRPKAKPRPHHERIAHADHYMKLPTPEAQLAYVASLGISKGTMAHWARELKASGTAQASPPYTMGGHVITHEHRSFVVAHPGPDTLTVLEAFGARFGFRPTPASIRSWRRLGR